MRLLCPHCEEMTVPEDTDLDGAYFGTSWLQMLFLVHLRKSRSTYTHSLTHSPTLTHSLAFTTSTYPLSRSLTHSRMHHAYPLSLARTFFTR